MCSRHIYKYIWGLGGQFKCINSVNVFVCGNLEHLLCLHCSRAAPWHGTWKLVESTGLAGFTIFRGIPQVWCIHGHIRPSWTSVTMHKMPYF